MLRSHIKLGSIFGIKVGLHYSWFLIAVLIALSFFRTFRLEFPQMGDTQVGIMGVSAALVFFISLLLHELSHSLVAKTRGIPVREITLFALGGVSQMEGQSVTAKDEFSITAAGPLASVAIGITLLGIAQFLGGPAATPATRLMSMLGYINLGLAVFNLIPGYPLDGGRILRAALWWKSGNLDAATRSAARAGQAVGFGFILFGTVSFFGGAGFSGLWIAFIGWFLVQAAGASVLEVGIKHALAGVRVMDVMKRDCPTVDRHTGLQELIEGQLLRTGNRCFIVVDNGDVVGLVTPKDITAIDRALWPTTAVDRVMRPLEVLRTVAPDDSLSSALEILSRENINQLPVVANGRLEGVLSRADVVNNLQTIIEFSEAKPSR